MKFERKYNFCNDNYIANFKQQVESAFMGCVFSKNNYYCHFNNTQSKKNKFYLNVECDKHVIFDHQQFAKELNCELVYVLGSKQYLDCVNDERSLDLETTTLINEVYFNNEYEIIKVNYAEGDDENFIDSIYEHYNFKFDIIVYQFKFDRSKI